MMRRGTVLALAILSGACGGATPSAPSPVVPTPTPATTYTLSGMITATNGGQPLTAALTINNMNASATAGAFTLALPSTMVGPLALNISGSGVIPRRAYVAGGSSRTVAIDAIADSGGFDLTFYRALIRNSYEQPQTSQPLRRWTRTPNVYLKTVDEAGEPILSSVLDQIDAITREAIPQWTGGVLGTPSITRGSDTREHVAGWLTIKFPASNTLAAGICGQSLVGEDGGWIELNYHNAPVNGVGCRVPGFVIAPRTIRHEIGHALGFYHTDSAADLMWGGPWTDPNQQPASRELYHAAIAYKRPIGNQDPDSDPSTAIALAPMRIP